MLVFQTLAYNEFSCLCCFRIASITCNRAMASIHETPNQHLRMPYSTHEDTWGYFPIHARNGMAIEKIRA